MAATMCGRYVDKVSLTFRRISCSSRFSTAVQTQVEDTEVDLYPPIKPKWPEGNWGAMTRRQAWLWHARKQEFLKLTTIKDRINELTSKEMKMWRYKLLEDYPRCFPYQQYATKTHVMKDLPQLYDSLEVEDIIEKIRPVVMENILFEHCGTQREKLLSKQIPWHREQYNSWIILKNLITTLTNCLSAEIPHLQNSQIDEDVRVEAFWDRHGYQRVKIPRYRDEEKKVTEIVQNSRLQSCYQANFVIRTEEPLPEFLSREDEVCVSGEYPELEYKPSTYGQVLDRHGKKPTVIAGHWPGDPCEFGLVTVNTMNQAYDLGEQFGPEAQEKFLLGMGMNVSFVRLVAEAHYQGFNSYVDLTYPLTTQTILSDGQNFTFFAYQLNTLELWKDDEAKPLRNLCWHTDTMKLYKGVEDGEVKGFSDDTLKHILRCLLLKPGRPGVDLRPTLPEPSPKLRTEHINEKVIEVKVKKEETYV